eukprot:6740637-Pyramimonas_sp.AAC.1
MVTVALTQWIRGSLYPNGNNPHLGQYKNPVRRLRLTLHCHPLAGVVWERHCRASLESVGFTPVPS